MTTTLLAIVTTPAAFLGTHPAVAFVGVSVEAVAVAVGLIRLRRHDVDESGTGN